MSQLQESYTSPGHLRRCPHLGHPVLTLHLCTTMLHSPPWMFRPKCQPEQIHRVAVPSLPCHTPCPALVVDLWQETSDLYILQEAGATLPACSRPPLGEQRADLEKSDPPWPR